MVAVLFTGVRVFVVVPLRHSVVVKVVPSKKRTKRVARTPLPLPNPAMVKRVTRRPPQPRVVV